MNKKRLIVSLFIFLVVIGIIIFLIINLNKNNDDKENKGDPQQTHDFKEYTTAEWKEYAKNYYLEKTGNLPADIKLYSDGSDVMIIEIYDNTDESNFVQKYDVNYKTGIGTDMEGNEVNLNLK